MKKLIERYIRLYIVEEVVLKNVVKFKLLVSIGIYPVVNISRVVRYKKLVKRQKVKELKPVEVNGLRECKVEKMLDRRKVRGIMKYLV